MSDGPITWDASLAPGQPIVAGGSSYSTTPLITEINGQGGQNQILALINRRTAQVLPALSRFSYLSADGPMLSASQFGALQTRINAIRAAVNVSPYTFTYSPASGQLIYAAHFVELESALFFSGNWSVSNGANRIYLRTDNPYGTVSGAPTSRAMTSGDFFGKNYTHSSGNIKRQRGGMFFAIPSGSGSGGTFTLTFAVGTFIDSLEAFTPACYASSTDDHAFGSGWQANLNTLLTGGTYGSSPQTFAVPGIVIAARAGSDLSLVFGEDAELTDGGFGSAGANAAAQFLIATAGFSATLSADYGF